VEPSGGAQTGPPLEPTSRSERIATLDILRGFALLGILLVNLELFFGSYYAYVLNDLPTAPLDLWTKRFIQFFAEGKFYSIFAFLFGMGMAIFQSRSQAKGIRFVPIYSRRLLVLLGFGLVHAFFLWTGDILIIYSVLGFIILFLFRNRRPRTLLVWAAIFLTVPILINGGSAGLMALGSASPEGAAMIDEVLQQQVTQYEALRAQADAVYSTGTWLEVTAQRTRDMGFVATLLPFIGFNVLAMMLAGFAAGRAGIQNRLDELRPQLRRAMLWGFIIGVIGNALYVYFAGASSRVELSLTTFISTTGQTLGAPALAIFYMSALTLATLQPPGSVRALPMAAAGRMAITNYLAQSLLLTTVAYGYGFGLYGLRAAWYIPIALGLWLLQLGFSSWWLRRFQFGPVEWFWRVLTYWRAEPFRKAQAA
jgi:uncharacterized protein